MTNGHAEPFILFELNNATYAVRSRDIQQLEMVGSITPVPTAPAFVEGVVSVVLPGTMFGVELDNKPMELAPICGKRRKRWVRLTAGDRVKMERSPYDLNKARITWRLR